jgi:cytochrome c553
MTMNFKQKTTRDVGYLKFLRTLPCSAPACKNPYNYVDAHHTETGGTGLTGSDHSAVPVCRECHSRIHNSASKRGPWQEDELKALLERLLAAYKMVSGERE